MSGRNGEGSKRVGGGGASVFVVWMRRSELGGQDGMRLIFATSVDEISVRQRCAQMTVFMPC